MRGVEIHENDLANCMRGVEMHEFDLANCMRGIDICLEKCSL